MLYWFTVDPELPDVLDVGIRNGIWGVAEDEHDAIDPLEPGDAILFFQRDHGFVMCEVESEPYTESVPVWTEVDYPHRVRISDPVETDRYAHLGEVHDCLLDAASGEPFSSVSNAEAALSGADGRLRPLADEEIRCLFQRLGWTLPPGVSPAPEAGEAEGEPDAPDEPEEGAGAEVAEAEDAEEEAAEAVAAEEEPAGEPDGEAGAEVAEAEGGEEEAPDGAPPPEDVPRPAEARPVGPAEGAGSGEGPDDAGVAEARPVAGRGEEEEAGSAETAEPGAEGAAAAGEIAAGEPAAGEEPGETSTVPRVLVAPAAGDPESRRRFEGTVADGVEARRVVEHLADDDREALGGAGGAGRVGVWGAAAGPDGGAPPGWEQAGPGDVVLFVGGGRVFASARVLLARHDPGLAEELWGGGGAGGEDAWPYVVLVSEPVSQDVALGELADAAGIDGDEEPARLTVLDPEGSLRVLGAFPELGLTAPRERGWASVGRPGTEAGERGTEGVGAVEPSGGSLSADEEARAGGTGSMDEARLRVLLFGRRQLGRCALCGRLYPVDLLSVVYVKPLSACTPEELDDAGNNVLPACRLGCAGLFRQGFVVVEEGRVERGRPGPVTDPVAERVEAIRGNRCEYWHSGSEPYFRWHADKSREA